MSSLIALIATSWWAPIPQLAVEDAYDTELAAKYAHAYRLPVPGEKVEQVVDTPEPPPAESPDAPTRAETVVTPEPEERRYARLSLSLEAGLPEGAGATVQLAPIDWLRFGFGGGSNGLSANVHGALALSPFHTAVRPVLWGEVAHGFSGDAGPLLKWISPGLAKAGKISGYDVAQMELSLEFGSKTFAFFLRGGVSYVDVALAPASLEVSGDTVDVKGGHVRALVPSGRLGLMVGFF